jgi:hypothetical protein
VTTATLEQPFLMKDDEMSGYFGVPGTGKQSSNEFLGRLQFDARVGFWCVIDREQQSDGSWADRRSDDVRKLNVAIDFASLEIGWLKLSSPPSFVLAPYGQMCPPQPQEMGDNNKRAFSFGFRVKTLSPTLFGDDKPRYLSGTSRSLLDPFNTLHRQYLMSIEAQAGQIPVVKVTGTTVTEAKTPQGTSRFHSPVFEIAKWMDRTPELGEAISATKDTTPVPEPVAAVGFVPNGMPVRHVPPPSPKAAPAKPQIDDDLPF